MIGGLIVMTFFGSSSIGGATSEACPSVDETAAPSATGAGAGGGGSTTGGGGGAVSPGFATSFEIGGKNVVLTFGTPSADFALGLSISEEQATTLVKSGFTNLEGLRDADVQDLVDILGIDEAKAREIHEAVKEPEPAQ